VQWEQQGLAPIAVCVHVSALQFRQNGFVNRVATILKESGLAPEYLEPEITESLIVSNSDVTLSVFRELNELGVKVSIDDFGTGYSSLSYLKHFPVYKLKIDRSFVRDVMVDADDAAITSTIISMAKILGLKVIAEGVERPEQVEYRQSQPCDEAKDTFSANPCRRKTYRAC
jgi:EAL domain-containing protein (putative c-di-GMP-specific phosphodiesterase class I)